MQPGQTMQAGGMNVSLVSVAQDENGRPLIVLRDEGAKKRTRGIEAHRASIVAATAMASILSSSFGPKGMDKLMVSQDRDVLITNDGATILRNMDVSNHIAKLMVELSECQDNEVGDGTTGVVILAGALLEHSEALLTKGIHPIRVSDGYDEACRIAVSYLEKYAEHADFTLLNRDMLMKAAKTSLYSKIVN
ncbi:chaperone tailless complex polypeptide 1, partial [Kipferlia bialata]|eukprot:g10813.t1